MLNNIIYKGHDNEVFIAFSFDGDFAVGGLTNFTEVKLIIGGEEYSTVSTPAQLSLEDDNTLNLSIGDITALDTGKYMPSIIGISATYDYGYVLNCSSSSQLDDYIILKTAK